MTKKFEIVYRDPADLIPYEMNAKKHDEQQIRDLAAAIKKRGFDQPITVDKNDVIITGHGRREAAIFAGLERVPVIVRDDLSDDEVRAKRLEDNRLASIDYDAIKLQKELESLVLDDIEVFGFEERELNVLVGSMTEEMDTDSLVIDLGEETKRQKDEHTEISREVAAEEVRVVDVLGFKTLPAGSAIVVGDLLAHMEEMTGESGVDAFVAYAENGCMSKYIINVSFQTRVNKTTRTLEIAESFGLGLDEKEWTLYDNLELEVKQGDVVYITGQSGSGKSVVLRELQRQMKDEGLSVASIDDFTFDNEVNVIDQLGKTTSDALGLLSMAGLNDAYLFVRKPSEMSDGQKYRLKIAKLIESGAKVWAADEFGAVLDRVTAQVVASNLQRAARKVGATVMVATTHEDLKNALRPDMQITKHYKERVKVEYHNGSHDEVHL